MNTPNLNTLSVEDLISSLKCHEIGLNEQEHVRKPKSIALKSKRKSSQGLKGNGSEDESPTRYSNDDPAVVQEMAMRSSHIFFASIWFACVWVLWKERNYRILKNIASDTSVLIEKVKLNSFLWVKSKQVSFPFSFHDWWKHPLLCMGVHL